MEYVIKYQLIGLLIIIPLYKIFKKAGFNPALSFNIFIPYIGFVIIGLILAFSQWPNIRKW